MIYSYEIEKQVLAGMMSLPEFWPQVASFITEGDFYDGAKLHKVIFNVVRNLLESKKTVDSVVVSERIKELGIKTPDSVNIYDYISALGLRQLNLDAAMEATRELKRLATKRVLYRSGEQIKAAMDSMPPEATFEQIIAMCDKIYNHHIDLAACEQTSPVDLYDMLPDRIEALGRGEEVLTGPSCPYPIINQIFGSLSIPGNITTIVARAGFGKTTLALDYATKLSLEHGIPVLHLDNGEMSEDELIIRQTAALSGVPIFLIQSGRWRHAGEETVAKVRSVYDKVKKIKLWYYNVAGKTPDEIANLLKRTYFKYLKRGDQLQVTFDYIKATLKTDTGSDMWLAIGELLDRLKTVIQKELVFDRKPCTSLFTSVQSNRSGIIGRKKSWEVTDDESIAGLSDMIIQISSHFFILRKKTYDEIIDENGRFGTHILVGKKARSLGEDIFGYLEPVKCGDTLRDNHINLDIFNFAVNERGDLRAAVKEMSSELGVADLRAPTSSACPTIPTSSSLPF